MTARQARMGGHSQTCDRLPCGGLLRRCPCLSTWPGARSPIIPWWPQSTSAIVGSTTSTSCTSRTAEGLQVWCLGIASVCSSGSRPWGRNRGAKLQALNAGMLVCNTPKDTPAASATTWEPVAGWLAWPCHQGCQHQSCCTSVQGPLQPLLPWAFCKECFHAHLRRQPG